MDEFPSNSKTGHGVGRIRPDRAPQPDLQEKPRITRIVEGEVIRRKKPLGRKFTDMFIGSDAKGTVGFIISTILIPTAQNAVIESGTAALERVFGQNLSPTSRHIARSAVSNAGHIAYNRMSQQSPFSQNTQRQIPSRMTPRGHAQHDFGEIIFSTKVEAVETLDQMFEVLSQYHVVAVSELYEMINEPANPIDTKWGWTVLNGSQVRRVQGGGYLLDLPKPEPID